MAKRPPLPERASKSQAGVNGRRSVSVEEQRAPKTEGRRVPTQARSKERLERILDSADGLFADVGFDAATMEAIAEKAGTSIGSVYQFFPNKRALFEALSQRYLERAEQLFEDLLREPPISTADWPQFLDNVIDAFWQFHVALPGFRAVWMHQNISPEMLVASDAVNRTIAERSETVIQMLAPHLSKQTRKRASALLVETVSAILFVAVRRDEPEASALVDELKRMVRAYLRDVLQG